MNILHSTMDVLRDKYLARVSHTSTFRSTGQITPEEFVEAGDFLVYKFPSWSWADAASPAKRAPHLPPGKQFLVTRGVPCRRRIDANFAGEAGQDETLVRDGFEAGASGAREDDDDGWLRTGNMAASQEARMRDVRTVDEAGEVGAADEEEEIPDMEDDDDEEAIIRDNQGGQGESSALRHYTLYISYTAYYKTPRLYLAGFRGTTSEPIPPNLMFEDIVGDYKDKTVTLEDFPFLDSGVKMASVHPCKHASVMKVLLDRADAALKLRMQRVREGKGRADAVDSGMEGLIDKTDGLKLAAAEKEKPGASGNAAGATHEEWEEVQHEGEAAEANEVAIRVDQYLVVFLKFIASVTPGIEHDFTMGV